MDPIQEGAQLEVERAEVLWRACGRHDGRGRVYLGEEYIGSVGSDDSGPVDVVRRWIAGVAWWFGGPTSARKRVG